MERTLTVRLDEDASAALSELEDENPGKSTAELIREAIEAGKSVVYFLRRQDGAVKVGYSVALRTRIGTLRSEYGELKLEALQPGGRSEESAWHDRLAKVRKGRTEWFDAGEMIDNAIREVVMLHGEPTFDIPKPPNECMRVNLHLDAEDAQHLAEVMAMMPTRRNAHGVPEAITMTDAVRWALERVATGPWPPTQDAPFESAATCVGEGRAKRGGR